jgi:hypothetical protein
MKRLFQPFLILFNLQSGVQRSRPRRSLLHRLWLPCLSLIAAGLVIFSQGIAPVPAAAQSKEQDVRQQENQLIRQFTLPSAPPEAPVYRPQPQPQPAREVPEPAPAPIPVAPVATPAPAKPPEKPKNTETVATGQNSEYVLEFNRSPAIGNRFRLQGVYDETPFQFTRPRNWKITGAKATIRYQHSPALLANRSNLLVRVNDTSVGSTALKLRDSQKGELTLDIPPNLLQDFNTLTVAVEQNDSTTCSNPADPSLWTEVLPDSRLVFTYQPQPIALDFSRYPYPFFDDLNLDTNRVAYLPPEKITDNWLTAASRLEASLGRLADYRPLETRLVKSVDQLKWNDRLAVIGTPAEQSVLKSLKLPFAIADNKILDGNKKPFPGDVGILMLATAPNTGVPVLVATGNSPEGVANAVQFLVQPENREIGTGRAIIVNDLATLPPPPVRQWTRYLPEENSFKLAALKTTDNKPFKDTTVRGSAAAPVEFDFRALPDDRFERGSSMNLLYSYSPQVNPRTSAVDVAIDGVGIGGKRLDSVDGGNRENLKVNLPENLIKPNSKIQVSFRLSPRDPAKCGVSTDQQLWGTVHSDTSFDLKRTISVQLPDLKLLTNGFPFAAPQDLSSTAIVLPDSTSNADITALLRVSERLGRLSQANSVRFDVYRVGALPTAVREQRHLIGIGLRDRFPFPEVFESRGFQLKNLFSRQWNQAQIQTLPDSAGVVKEVISPWNRDRVVLALAGQNENGLQTLQTLFSYDTWFYKLHGDTALIKANQPNPSPYDNNAVQMEFLGLSESRRFEQANPLNRVSRFFQDNWFFLPSGIVAVCLLLYGISQLFFKQIEGDVK